VKLPVNVFNGAREGGQLIETRESAIVAPNAKDMALYSGAEAQKTCGSCAHFERDVGQARIQGQRFVERLVQEEGWKVEHLCSPVNQLGLCGLWEGGESGGKGSTLTGPMHRACDQHKPANGLMRIRRRKT
jgi:hypothetical protein